MIASCNDDKCKGKWEANVNLKFSGQAAVRIVEFSTCPTCGRTDSHWVYANDNMPADVKNSQFRKPRRDWLENN